MSHIANNELCATRPSPGPEPGPRIRAPAQDPGPDPEPGPWARGPRPGPGPEPRVRATDPGPWARAQAGTGPLGPNAGPGPLGPIAGPGSRARARTLGPGPWARVLGPGLGPRPITRARPQVQGPGKILPVRARAKDPCQGPGPCLGPGPWLRPGLGPVWSHKVRDLQYDSQLRWHCRLVSLILVKCTTCMYERPSQDFKRKREIFGRTCRPGMRSVGVVEPRRSEGPKKLEA